MSTTTVSGGVPAADDELLRGTFHVVPPPPPKRKAWSELAIAIGLALLINAAVLLSFILTPPVERPAEPPAISVDLVPEPRAQPEPQPEPQPAPEPQPEPQPEPEREPDTQPEQTSEEKASGFFTSSGAGTDAEDEGSGGEKKTEIMAQPDEAPEDQTVRQREKTVPDEEIPGWAMNVGQGYGVPRGNPNAAGRDRTAGSGAGGDAYMNSVRDCIARNFVFPPEAAGRSGVAVISLDVHRSGKIMRLGFIKSAGVAALDRAAVETIGKCAPFPPFPAGAPQDVEPFALTLPMPLPPG